MEEGTHVSASNKIIVDVGVLLVVTVFIIIIAIIVVGLILLFLEIFLIPGTTLFGIAGGVALITGVLLVYYDFGNKWGNIAVAITLFLVAVAVVAGFKVIEEAPVFLPFWKNGCKYFNITGPDGERLEFNQIL